MEPGKIQKLDEAVINRIAAGEVIQRPANALKELIENCLDAQSTNIQITSKNGGLKLLQIQDNGCGIRKEDFDIVCERFTTSKLKEFEDLNTISTYGFRGEALASISHVAHLTIISKTSEAKCAYRGSYEDSKLKDVVKPIAGNQGTLIMVEDLFYNMNVRRNALRGAAEEYQKISDVVGKYAIHNPKTGFTLKKDNNNCDIRTNINSTIIDNIRTIYGSVIARELIEFNLENQAYKFKANGYMTNVNYSTKKLQFVLFINHRLVDCQSLKKCIDQIYTTYLPKNSHPFVYLSLEIEPRNIDVNVHPTKHEVHFLNEEEIVESITTAVETKLLGSNNSRVFYTQAKLPHAPEVDMSITSNANKTIVYDKDLVRTDSTEQKLEKFFGPVKNKKQDKNDDSICIESDEEFKKGNEDFLKRNESFEHKLVANSTEKNVDVRRVNSATNFAKEKVIVPSKLRSIQQLQSEIEDNCEDHLRDIFVEQVFVGAINPGQGLVQRGTRLYLCNTRKIMEELFYQFVIFHFHNFNSLELSEPLPIIELAKMALGLPETGWTPEDGDKDVLAGKVADILIGHREMLEEYFSLSINEDGQLKSIPILLDKHIPEMSGLPLYILRLATEVSWKEEKECFKTFARETALYYANMEEKEGWEYTTEHVLYSAMKDYFVPNSDFKKNGSILEIANLPNLYKVFERC